jgi:hypothetical protein
MPGAVYAEQLAEIDAEGRVGRVDYNPELPVQTAWDIGPANTAIWFFQEVGDRYHFIDYSEGAGSIKTWVEHVRSKPYNYDHAQVGRSTDHHEIHYGPHDLEYTDYSTGKTRYGAGLEHDFRFTVLGRGSVEDGIEAARKMLRRSWFDERRCEAGLAAVRSYRYELDERLQTYRRVPVHDWASHGSDALRYAAVGVMPALSPLAAKVPEGSFDYWADQIDRAHRGLPVRSYRVGS